MNKSNVGSISVELTPMAGGKTSRQEARANTKLPLIEQAPSQYLYLIINHSLDVGRYDSGRELSFHQANSDGENRRISSPAVAAITHSVTSAYNAELLMKKQLTSHFDKYGKPNDQVEKFLGFDELHFFGSSVYEFLIIAYLQGWKTLVTGLDFNGKEAPFVLRDGFYDTLLISKLSTSIVNNGSQCVAQFPEDTLCGREAVRTAKLFDKTTQTIENYEGDVLEVGDLNAYAPRCLECNLWSIPGQLDHFTTWRAMRLISLDQQLNGLERHIDLGSILEFNESTYSSLAKGFTDKSAGFKFQLESQGEDHPDYNETQRLWLLAEEAISASHYFNEFYLPTLVSQMNGGSTGDYSGILDKIEARVNVLAGPEIRAVTRIGDVIEVR